MKIIHCADVHLCSPLTKLENTDKRKERKTELIKAFTNMIEFASKEGVKAVIIAGDLFDQSHVSATAKNAVLGSMNDNPEIAFYYLKGNHDKSDFIDENDEMPSNLYLFTDEWTSYDLGENVIITGVELTSDNAATIYSGLNLDVTKFNIVTMHGQEAMASSKDNAQIISIRDLKNKNIDYLALGHVHTYKTDKLDSRGIWCYSGCLEARGYDEAGEHGFVVLDVNGKDRTYSAIKIDNSIRDVHLLKVDISGLMTSMDILKRIDEALRENGYSSRDMIKVELVGAVDFECEKNAAFIEKRIEDRFFDFKIKDSTGFCVDYEKYRLDESLKGEFIRTVEAEKDISEEDKAEIIRTGIRALMGEEI